MRMEKRKFRIGQLAKLLQVERFVVRFWEKEFNIRTTRSIGGQRFYTEDDLNTFKKIKELLYEKGFTITGARKQLRQKIASTAPTHTVMGSHKTTMSNNEDEVEELHKQLITLQKKLKRLQQLL